MRSAHINFLLDNEGGLVLHYWRVGNQLHVLIVDLLLWAGAKMRLTIDRPLTSSRINFLLDNRRTTTGAERHS